MRTAIKGYYGDTAVAGTDPVSGSATTLHQASPTSAYAKEVGRLEKSASGYLSGATATKGTKKAILLDVDDTSVLTYDYEIYSNFAYNFATNAAFVHAGFPAVFGMPQLVQKAEQQGYTVFFLTGRGEGQRADTENNLKALGYPVTSSAAGDNVDNVFLKDLTHTWTTCDSTGDNVCTTSEVKSETRKYIESLGYDIKGNFGDQFSDLSGGYADKTFKLPNPMYYLP